MLKIAVVVGSLRKESINRKLAAALGKLAGDRLDFQFVEIGDLPFFNQDLEQAPPAQVLRLRQEIAQADGVLLVSPEYNRSTTPVLKNAIDWVSRPYGKNGWAGKPGAIIGASLGAIGTAVAQSHLRSIMTILQVPLLTQPELYFVSKEGLIDEDDEITDDNTRAFLQGWVDKFADWVEKHAA